MISVTIYKREGLLKSIKVSGHSGYADEGKDIVCAAVSALVINAANSLEKFTKDDFQVKSDEKSAAIEISFNSSPSHDAKLLMDSLIMGLEEIRNGSEKFIEICYKEG